MMFWVLLGYLAFTSMMGRPSPRWDRARAVGAGVLFGGAILTKDEAALLTVGPLLAAAVLRWGPRRSLTLLTAATAVACYGAYVTVVTAAGDLGALSEAKTMGAQRLLGLVQTTGFHGPGEDPSAAGSPRKSAISGRRTFSWRWPRPPRRWCCAAAAPGRGLSGFLYLAAAMALGYALVLGTLEEQELYLLVVPSLMVIPVAATLPRDGRGRDGRGREGPVRPATTAIIGALALGLAIGLNVATCLQWRQRPDDGYARLIGYMAAHVPAHATVTAVDGTAEAGITQYALALPVRRRAMGDTGGPLGGAGPVCGGAVGGAERGLLLPHPAGGPLSRPSWPPGVLSPGVNLWPSWPLPGSAAGQRSMTAMTPALPVHIAHHEEQRAEDGRHVLDPMAGQHLGQDLNVAEGR